MIGSNSMAILRNQGTLKISSLFMLQWCNFYWELRCFFLTALHFISAMQTASKNLMETLSDIYEKEWVGQDMLYVQVLKTKNLGWTRAVFQLDVGCEKQFVWRNKCFRLRTMRCFGQTWHTSSQIKWWSPSTPTRPSFQRCGWVGRLTLGSQPKNDVASMFNMADPWSSRLVP